ncbi:hypothetical protein J7E96_36485 [Streptomyces sp. ISL-96]|uniref:hypothetical protein n=1 Tax=Streptomyces sp. ISL-96 TaxID=2819191 RepID=UPI001BE637EB|nr:hypothetical protein [Streptomyces sp. ISL-96]MBT2493895.1 hypothetical protein [Streptomyces sp. ISL-96]
MADALAHEAQLLAEIGQASGEDVQLGGAAADTVLAAPLRGGFERLVQPGHCTEVPREDRREQLLELFGPGGGETVIPVGGRSAEARTRSQSSDASASSAACPRYG